ncbi:unnamed protein product [marine sediment metagenome]|uniref:Uncharacterized protein n=1 Tax=marine sediment metagenome TaxID=412755 RepID=X1AIY1_9ZZZZ
MNSNEGNMMSVKSRFCKTLSEVKEKEMLAFIKAIENKKYRKASESLESLFAMQELGMDICPRA